MLVIDDEVDTAESAATREARSHPTQHDERCRQKRIEYCRRFGLIPVDEQHVRVPGAIARALFVAPLQWTSPSTTLPSSVPVLTLLEHHLGGAQEIVSLVLLDLHVAYGRLEHGVAFDAAHPEFGLRAVLPEILSRFGTDSTSPGNTWTRCPVVVVSALSKDALDEEVRRGGARGMISKRTDPDRAREQLAGYLAAHGLLADNRGYIVGQSLQILNVLAAARRAAAGRSSVLLLGESGTGKELLARYIHDHSTRALRPYGVYHAAGRGDELQEDELFGHWAGAFTGAARDQPGLLEELNGGTVFIDELGDIAPRVQNALMRPLQERQSARIGRPRDGEERVTSLDLKFVFATNKDLDEAVANQSFRDDLLQRLCETVVHLPPIRDRREDIPLLASGLLRKIDDDLQASGSESLRHRLDDDALAYLQTLDYRQGNVRQLRSLILQVALANPSEPRLTRTDFVQTRQAVSHREVKTIATPEHPQPPAPSSEQLEALRRWVVEGPETIPLGELQALVASLRGSAPAFVVALLEVAVAGAKLAGRPSLARVVTELWGRSPATPQEARRALARVLAVDWQGGRCCQPSRDEPAPA